MPGCRLLPSTIAAEKAQRPGHHGSLLRAGAYLVYSLFCPQLKPSLKVCLPRSIIKCRLAKIYTFLTLTGSKVCHIPACGPTSSLHGCWRQHGHKPHVLRSSPFCCFPVLLIAGGHIVACKKLRWRTYENVTTLAFKTPMPFSKQQVEDSQCQ